MKKQLFGILCFLFISISYAQIIIPGCTSTTWDGTTWSNGAPNGNISAVIAGDYNTLTDGNFSCCELLINTGVLVTITDNLFISVRRNAIINGNLVVQTQGSFVQIEDGTSFNLNGNATVNKTTAPYDSATEVTYWSPPVEGQTIDDVFGATYGGYRYYFKTENFEDSQEEIGNTGVFIAGQDGFDDDYNSWTFANTTDPAETGVGYIARQAPGTPAGTTDYTFSGQFHNGIITVPITRNDDNLANEDENPIFIGNPYASGISVEKFFEANTYHPINNPNGIIGGYAAFWSAHTPPSGNNQGGQVLNFLNIDYAYINSMGAVRPSSVQVGDPDYDDVLPNGSIASAQGFFVNYSDDAPSATGDIIFNNGMREVDGNEQFFRTANTGGDNKLWLNLNSPTGVNHNILIGYADAATSGDDGQAYDLRMSTPRGAYGIIYSNIDGSDEKYNIQGKNTYDLNRSEKISIGLFNSVESAEDGSATITEYTISISDVKGDFMSNRKIYINDTLLDICHDLTASSYTFTSEVGEFNDRFTLSFLDCSFSDTCSAVFDEVASFVEKRTQCGKYTINFPGGYDFSANDLVLTQDGVDTQLTEDTNVYFIENGINEFTISVYDSNKQLCYSNEIIREVDCFNDKCGDCEDAYYDIVDLIQDRNQCGKFKIVFPKRLRDCYSLVVDANGIIIPMEENTTIRYQEDGIFTLNITLYDKETGKECYTGSTLLTVDCYGSTNRNVNSDDEDTIEFSKGMKLFPNPATNEFTVKFDDASEVLQQLTLKNIMGKVLKLSNSETVQLNGLRTGIYFVEIVTKDGNVYRKQLIVK
ncbi:T9SS type A sorting domain-containing protein [Winogradskyella forsetii]|uniref:T9SS type A sorting domain-containing protein n=1 Tax=Winogradskyella forsetii TaxID=2686077 RepID=UPI0015BC5DA3|nr:T9SS type A sorting domain-containing protein [Winogradskyella forsetii]